MLQDVKKCIGLFPLDAPIIEGGGYTEKVFIKEEDKEDEYEPPIKQEPLLWEETGSTKDVEVSYQELKLFSYL